MIEVSTGTTHFASNNDSIAMMISKTTFGPLPGRIDGTAELVTGQVFARLLHWADYRL